MDPFEWLKHRWQAPSTQYSYVHVDPTHVDLGDGRAQDATNLVAGEHYFRLWLSALALENDRQWFKEWMPAAYSVVRFKFGDQDATLSHIAGQTMLAGVDESVVGRRVSLNYPMTALAPFNGGSIEMETGLVAVPGRDEVGALLNVLGRFSKVLVVPQLSAVLSAAGALAEGFSEFLGASKAQPVLRFHNTFTAGDSAGANRLRGGYFLVASKPEGEIDPRQLWIQRDRPFYGATAATAKPLSGCDYLLFRLEVTTTRDDWESLTSIQQPYQQAISILQQAAMEPDPPTQQRLLLNAERQRDAARFAALRAPELTTAGGRNQVMAALLQSFEDARKKFAPGLGEGEPIPTLGAAIRRGLPASAANAIGPLPAEYWLSTDRPQLPAAVTAAPRAHRGARAAPPPAPVSPARRGGHVPANGGAATPVPPATRTRSRMPDAAPTAAPPPAERSAPDAGAAAPEASATKQVVRTPHMDVHPAAPLKPGQAFTVKVWADQLAARAGEITQDIDVSVPVDLHVLDLEIWLAGTSHFEFPGPRVKPFVIDTNAAAAPAVEFDVVVRADVQASAIGDLSANFTYRGRPCGRVSVAIEIVVAGAVADPPAADVKKPAMALRIDAAAKLADLTIEIIDPDNTRQRLQCRVSSPHLAGGAASAPFAWNLNQQTGELVKAYMSQFVQSGISDEERLLNLRGAGRQLWDLVPREIKDAFWQLVDEDKLDTIQIASEEPFIPWELMVPRRGSTTLPPLGAAYAVGRWLPRDFQSPPQSLALGSSLVVAPVYGPPPDPEPLAFAPSEMKLVLDTVPGAPIDPAGPASVRAGLLAGGASLLHFVCHGADSAAFGIQAIMLAGGQLTSLQIAGMDLSTAFANRPLVFLNACEIGRPSVALVGIGGFAKAFLDAGAGAVIAPLWSVKDSVAHEIAETFYRQLKEGSRIRPAEILRDVRRQAYVATATTAGEDTYAAYCFYGDPEAVAFIASEGARA